MCAVTVVVTLGPAQRCISAHRVGVVAGEGTATDVAIVDAARGKIVALGATGATAVTLAAGDAIPWGRAYPCGCA